MDFLYTQMRGRLSSAEQGKEEQDGESKPRDKKLQPQKSQSFKEVKKTPSWLQRQFSRQINRGSSKNWDEYQAAVAAAAFAIKSLEESQNKARKKEGDGPVKPEHKVSEPVARTQSVKFPDGVLRKKSDIADNSRVPIRTETIGRVPGKAPSIKKRLSFTDNLNDTASTKTEKATGPASSMKKTSTFGDKNLDSGAAKRPATSIPKPPPPSPTRRVASKIDETRRQSSGNSGAYYTEADAWEKAELTKIKEKYEKLDSTIVDWENKKKLKAKSKPEKMEAALEKRRAKATQNYRDKVSRVDNIAGGARTQAGKNRRNEELKVKEKANKMRVTGKPPRTCLCC